MVHLKKKYLYFDWSILKKNKFEIKCGFKILNIPTFEFPSDDELKAIIIIYDNKTEYIIDFENYNNRYFFAHIFRIIKNLVTENTIIYEKKKSFINFQSISKIDNDEIISKTYDIICRMLKNNYYESRQEALLIILNLNLDDLLFSNDKYYPSLIIIFEKLLFDEFYKIFELTILVFSKLSILDIFKKVFCQKNILDRLVYMLLIKPKLLKEIYITSPMRYVIIDILKNICQGYPENFKDVQSILTEKVIPYTFDNFCILCDHIPLENKNLLMELF